MPALAATFGLTADQGATFKYVLTWTNPDDTPINLQGYTARMKVRRRTTTGDLLLELTTENGYISLGGDSGEITLTMPPDVTSLVRAGKQDYDLELISSAGEVTRLLMGYFVIRSEVTT
jgi:hypothetical protein